MLPIVYIKKLTEVLVDTIRQNQSQPDETQSFLYQIFGGTVDKSFDFYEQSKSLFMRGTESPRNIKVSYELPKEKTGLPCYVVREPDRKKGPGNGIGKIVAISPNGQDITYRDHRRYHIEILCVSDNYLESLIMGESMYAAYLAAYDTLIHVFDTIEFGQEEVMVNSELVPYPIFMKTICFDLSSEELVPSFSRTDLLSSAVWNDAGLSAYQYQQETTEKPKI